MCWKEPQEGDLSRELSTPLTMHPSVQEGHPCQPPPALSRAGTADSKRGSQQIPAPFSLVINGAALPMNLPLILRKL